LITKRTKEVTNLNLLRQSGWLRALEILTGLLTIVFGILVFAFPEWGVTTLVFLLSVGLFFIGFRSIALLGLKDVSKGIKVLNAIIGIISLILAALVVGFPSFGIVTLLSFVSLGLIVHGVGRMFLAYALKETVSWIRRLMVAVGVVDVILSIVVLFLPGLALLVFASVLALLLILNGAEMVASGVIGRTWLGDFVDAAMKEIQ
jgi:membrane protein HdeD